MDTTYDIENGFVQVPVQDFEVMQGQLENMVDEAVLAHALDNIKEFYPALLVENILNGENAVKLFRAYRRMTQVELAAKADVSQALIVKIENGRSSGSIETMKAIAQVLDVDLEMLV